MSNWWHPKPLHKGDPSPLFSMDRDEEYVVKSENAIQRQRTADGTPHTKYSVNGLQAKDYTLYLEGSKVSKSKSVNKDEEDVDPDEVVKAYMGQDEKDEDAEKGTIGEAVAGAGKKVLSAAGGVVSNTVHSASKS